jgi:ubiquinone/menaquinone biosynthesis C-methylase UbiE
MNPEIDYIEINKQSWNNRTDFHVNSSFYDMDSFYKGKNSLNDIELNLLGNLKGKSILHLQCHFGQDSISLQRLGAEVVGVDLSDKSIEMANEIALKTNSNAKFICSDLYNLPNVLDKQFDIVYSSYGTIGWLPDLDKWASVIQHFLKPNGKFVFVEFHPVVWMFDDDFDRIGYNYFNTGPIVETEIGTYADRNADLKQEYVMWNHGLGEVMNSLIKNGLSIFSFEEFDYSPYSCFRHTVEYDPKKFRIKHLDNKIPMVYAITSINKA